jgi:predicted O-methyltransferase YrrM
MSNSYAGSSSRAADIALVARTLMLPETRVEEAFAELESDTVFLDALRARFRAVRSDASERFDLGRFTIFYALVRVSAPRTVIETGVHDGLSSALLLRAIQRNGSGHLTSIDLPSPDLPPGAKGPGWLVGDEQRAAWTLLLGDSRKLLGPTAAAAGGVDLFLHDSDHSRAHREFEFRTVRPHLSERGLIVSDDDEPTDTLLDDLAAEWKMTRGSNAVPDATGPWIGILAPLAP